MKKCLMMILLIALLMPMISAIPQEPQQAPTREQILSSIDPNNWYSGSDVRDCVSGIFLIADDEIRLAYQQGVNQGAVMAAVPLLVANAGLQAWQDGAEEKLKKNFWNTMLWVGGGIVTGFIIGVVVK